LQGLYYALREGRFFFDFVHEDDLRTETLSRYRALLIPNAAYLSDQHCRQIRDYVRGGGSLLATFETSLYSEWGDRLADFAHAAHQSTGGAVPRSRSIARRVLRGRRRAHVLALGQSRSRSAAPEHGPLAARRYAAARLARRRRHRRDVRLGNRTGVRAAHPQ